MEVCHDDKQDNRRDTGQGIPWFSDQDSRHQDSPNGAKQDSH
jgi:hypothetical protein